MKRLLSGAFALLLSFAVSATTLNPVQLLNPVGSTSGQAIVSTGASTAPGWTSIVDSLIAGAGVTLSGATGTVTISIGSNAISLSQLSQQTANTVAANATGSTANLTAFAMPSCSTSSSALDWTTNIGFTCNTAVNAAQLSGNAIGTSGAAVPLLNGANTWSGAQTFTSTITPSQTSGIVGTTAANNANAGSVGEFISNTTTGTSLTTGSSANCTSVSLTAGDWEVSGTVEYIPAGSTTVSYITADISLTSGSFNAGLGASNQLTATFTTGDPQFISSPIFRVSQASTTTVYLIGNANFGTSTMTCSGAIRARRVR